MQIFFFFRFRNGFERDEIVFGYRGSQDKNHRVGRTHNGGKQDDQSQSAPPFRQEVGQARSESLIAADVRNVF